MLLFVLGLIAFSWPLVASSPAWSLSQLLGYLFTSWVIAVVLMYLVSRSASQQMSDSARPPPGESH